MIKDVIGYVQYQMETDDSATIKDNAKIAKAYQNADAATKEVIDGIFANLCGFTLATVLESADHCEDEDEEE